MRVTRGSEFAAGLGLSVTEAARRAQIIEATIEVVAELGYGNASFARIVRHAGLSSTRMISYHFAGKEELMMATLQTIIDNHDAVAAEYWKPSDDRQAMLKAYIESEIAFLAAYPRQARALTEIGANARAADGTPLFEMVIADLAVGRCERQLRQGQEEGAFGRFDPAVMAMAIRQALDGVAVRLSRDPELDLARYGRELAELFTKATAPS